jgi:CBS domain-containing protein
MLREYPSLPILPLVSASGLQLAAVGRPAAITLDSPALEVMTDFTKVPAASIEQEALATFANEYMRRRNVRSLIVTNADGVAGIITATDVLGEKPVKFALEYGVKRDEVRVSDIMTPRALLEFLAYADVRQARVGHLVESFRQAGRQHFLVRDQDPDGNERVRGIFSLSQIARQLGLEIQPTSFAHTFAEIEAALSH